ncbi:hypothetical protein F3Y22_tig00110057pilonHSYRG00187 [Hibiscus syriacus]|uniref:Uncharacterized protein n=1 Tax=Hibiscus syriacus TaxID=106335 RepID=A0A6A3BQ19_HIBSY|nr:hypothetical protein F3Y22_tig00110057pilonHSYRG00187 [Hibiscus syriacus]
MSLATNQDEFFNKLATNQDEIFNLANFNFKSNITATTVAFPVIVEIHRLMFYRHPCNSFPLSTISFMIPKIYVCLSTSCRAHASAISIKHVAYKHVDSLSLFISDYTIACRFIILNSNNKPMRIARSLLMIHRPKCPIASSLPKEDHPKRNMVRNMLAVGVATNEKLLNRVLGPEEREGFVSTA